MMDGLLDSILKRGFKNKLEVSRNEFNANVRWMGREATEIAVAKAEEAGLIKKKMHGGRLILNFDLFK